MHRRISIPVSYTHAQCLRDLCADTRRSGSLPSVAHAGCSGHDHWGRAALHLSRGGEVADIVSGELGSDSWACILCQHVPHSPCSIICDCSLLHLACHQACQRGWTYEVSITVSRRQVCSPSSGMADVVGSCMLPFTPVGCKEINAQNEDLLDLVTLPGAPVLQTSTIRHPWPSLLACCTDPAISASGLAPDTHDEGIVALCAGEGVHTLLFFSSTFSSSSSSTVSSTFASCHHPSHHPPHQPSG